MDISSLDQALAITDGKLTLAADTLPGTPLQALLTSYNGGLPITIAGAGKQTGTAAITVTGTASFMNVPDAPVTAVFTLDGGGNPVASLRFTLIGDSVVKTPWKFSTSFPDLPPFPNFGQSSTFAAATLLDQLSLLHSAFVLNTAAGTDAATGAPLAAGLNFVGQLKPSGILGLFDPLAGGDAVTTLYGTVTMPVRTSTTPQLPPQTFPWQPLQWPVPGIQLQAALGIKLTLGKLTLDETCLKIYSPTSNAWLAQNAGYTPDLAVTGTFSIPSADLTVDAVAILAPGQVTLTCQFDGFTLEKLEQLTDLAQGGDLLSYLPPDLQAQLQKLGGLSLVKAGIGFTGSLSPEAVEYAYCSVGMPKLNWGVFDAMTVEAIIAQFMIAAPFTASRTVNVTVEGTLDVAGATFDIFTSVPNFTIRANLQRTAALPLTALFAKYLPELPAPPDLSVSEMQLWITPGQSYSFSAIMAADPSWKLELGPTGLTISNVRLDLAKQSGAGATGSFSGTLAFSDDLLVDARYDLPGSFMVRAQLPDLKLSELIALFDQLGVKLPTGFEVSLQQPYVLLLQDQSSLTFTAATAVENLGLLALTAQKQTQTGVAVGIELDVPKLSSLAGLAPLSAIEDVIGLQDLMLVASSLADPGFQFPDLANFQAQPLQGKSISLPAQASGLAQGLNVYAKISTTKSQAFQALAKYLGIKLDGTVGITLAISLPDPAVKTKLYLAVNEAIQKGTTLKGQLGVALLGGEPTAFVSGIVDTVIQKQPAEFTITSAVTENGVMIGGSMQGTVHFDPAPVQLSNLALVVGIDWEGIPSLGIAATLDVKDFNTALAIFFDSQDPAKSLFAGAISGVTLAGIAHTLAGQSPLPGGLDDVLRQIGLKELHAFNLPATLATALDNRDLAAIAAAFQSYGSVKLPTASNAILLEINTKGSVWHLTDMTTMLHYTLTNQGGQIAVSLQPQIYCAPVATYLGGLTFPADFRVDAGIDFLVLQAQLRVEINPNQGISADVDVKPIVIYSPDFFAVTAATGDGGPHLSLATFSQPNQPDPNLRSPHFLVNGKLRLLGLDISSTYITVGSQGLTFNVTGQVSPVINLNVNGSFNSLNSLGAGGGITVGIAHGLDLGPLGHIDVKTDVKGTLDLGYKNGAAYATIQGGFDFQGIHGDIPKLSLNVTGKALANIADTLWDQVKDIITKALKGADQWLNWVKSGVIQGAGQTAAQVGQVLSSVYHLSPNDIATKTQKILGYGIDGIASALQAAGATADQAVQVLAGLGYQAADITRAVGAVFKGIHVDTSFGHVDTSGPHLDTPKAHVDVPRTHIDTAQHGDIGGNHVDTGHGWTHIDTGTPHADTRPHVDQTTTPHADTNTPHADSTPHVDTGTHVDVKS